MALLGRLIAGLFAIAVVIVFTSSESFAGPHAMGSALEGAAELSGFTFTVTRHVDRKHDVSANGVDFNMTVVILNAGIGYRKWGEDAVGWKGHDIEKELTWYLGLGLGGLFQTQLGLSNTGTSVRLRSNIVLSEKAPFYGRRRDGLKHVPWITLAPMIEFSPGSHHRNTVYGIGVGVSF
ncbi:MAG: hypothetical protein OEV59_05550 [Deltaproteobacteria bacterium]|nr:hypothetical protein [Deltaproteobacteria bacterium]